MVKIIKYLAKSDLPYVHEFCFLLARFVKAPPIIRDLSYTKIHLSYEGLCLIFLLRALKLLIFYYGNKIGTKVPIFNAAPGKAGLCAMPL